MNPELQAMFTEELHAARNSTLSDADLANDNVNLTPATREQVEQIIARLLAHDTGLDKECMAHAYRAVISREMVPMDLLWQALQVALNTSRFSPTPSMFLHPIVPQLHRRRFVQERAERALGETK